MITKFKKYTPYKTITFFYVLLYIVFLISIFFTIHTHKLPDGRTIAHSHFSLNNEKGGNNKGDASHSHRDDEFLYIISTKDLQIVIADGLQLNPVKREFELQFINPEEQLVTSSRILKSNKSPPAFRVCGRTNKLSFRSSPLFNGRERNLA